MIRWLRTTMNLAPSLPLYGAIVITGKIFAVAPSPAGPQQVDGPAMTSHSLAVERVALHHAGRCIGQEASIAGRNGEDQEDHKDHESVP